MPASRALAALLLLLLLLPGAAAAAAGCPALRSKAELDAFSASNSPLRKAVFLSKLGKSSLCDKLLAKYAGRLDLAVVGKDSPDLAARLAVDEWPALRVLPRGGGTPTQAERYEGGFRFGAFDAIEAWLDPLAPRVPVSKRETPHDTHLLSAARRASKLSSAVETPSNDNQSESSKGCPSSGLSAPSSTCSGVTRKSAFIRRAASAAAIALDWALGSGGSCAKGETAPHGRGL